MSDKQVDELVAIIASTQALLLHLQQSLKGESLLDVQTNEQTPNALALSSSAASLIKAQTTKLSLLSINKPFTPSAISTIIKTLSAECIPALVTAVQLADGGAYPRCIHHAMATHTSTLLLEFQSLLKEIPVDEKGIEKSQGRDTLASTGVIWNACDALTALGEGGIPEVAAKRAADFHNLVKDALEELREWIDSGPENANDESDSETDPDIFDSKCPSTMKPLAEYIVRVIEHIRLLYPALIKRRIRRFPHISAAQNVDKLPDAKIIARLDVLVDVLGDLSSEIDEAAGKLYEHEQDQAMDQVSKLYDMAGRCAKSMRLSWADEDDELTNWLDDKWLHTLEKVMSLSVPVT